MNYSISNKIRFRILDDIVILYNWIDNRYFILENTAFDIFNFFITYGNSLDNIVKAMTSIYDISYEESYNDILIFLESLCEYEILEDNKESSISVISNKEELKQGFFTDEQDIYNLMAEKEILLSVTFEITEDCNENCIHCYRPEKKLNIWNKKLYSKFLYELKKMGTLFIDFTGGEPFVHPDILNFLQIAADMGFIITILTNGTKINKDDIKYLTTLPIRDIHISLYSTQDIIHDKITGLKGSYNKTINTILALKNNGINVNLSCIIMSENKNELKGLASFAKINDLKCDFSFKIAPSYNSKNPQLLNCFSEDYLYQYSIDPDIKLYNDLYKNIRPHLSKTTNKNIACQAGFRTLAITPEGNIIPCTALRFPMGNILTDSIANMWKNSSDLHFWRNKANKIKKDCINCKALDICEPCPANYYAIHKNFNDIDEVTCNLGRSLYNISEKIKSNTLD